MLSAVGLLFVGAVPFLNALVSLGKVDARSAAPFNLLVGTLQEGHADLAAAMGDSAEPATAPSGRSA